MLADAPCLSLRSGLLFSRRAAGIFVAAAVGYEIGGSYEAVKSTLLGDLALKGESGRRGDGLFEANEALIVVVCLPTLGSG